MSHTGLIIVDVQNDFCEGGALEVPHASEIVPRINAISGKFDAVVLTQDWHPAHHNSFAENHAEKGPYQSYEASYGEQILWPTHCVQGSEGAAFHPELETRCSHLIIRKGFRAHIDSYSAFFENDKVTPTGLHGYLQDLSITRLVVVGLAYDFCVQFSALDAALLGYDTTVVTSLCRSIDLNGSKAAATVDMKQAGISLVDAVS